MNENELQKERKAAKVFNKIGLYLRAGAKMNLLATDKFLDEQELEDDQDKDAILRDIKNDIDKSNKKTTEKIFFQKDHLLNDVISEQRDIVNTKFGTEIFPSLTEGMTDGELIALRDFTVQVLRLTDKAIIKNSDENIKGDK